MSIDTLGDRMKQIESTTNYYLVSKTPVMLRLDGKSFSSLTKKMKPYNQDFAECMQATATYLCQNISGAKIAYTQSDEITLLILDWKEDNTQPWFGNRIQKIVSVSAALATAAFNKEYGKRFPDSNQTPVFDARVWNIPAEEVINAFIWRQNDATRNSLACLCQANFSAKQLMGKKAEEQHDLLHSIGINWNNCPVPQKRGVCIVKEKYLLKTEQAPEGVERSRWVADLNIPIFSQEKDYISKLLE